MPEPSDSIVSWLSTVIVGLVEYIGRVMVPSVDIVIPQPEKIAES